MCKKAVISFANNRGNYMKGLTRLMLSVEERFEGDFLGIIGESSVGAPPHEENPYAFKIYCFDEAIKRGYEQILWLDSSCFAIKDIEPIFDYIGFNGYIAQESGHFLGSWCNDEALNYFGITREEAILMPMIGNAGFLGLDINNHKAQIFFHKWKQAMLRGKFKGSWDNHRHDMSASSALWNQLNMKMVPGNEWLEYGPQDGTAINETILIKAEGI